MTDETAAEIDRTGQDTRDGGARQTRRTVPAWDLPTRLFHWILVVLLAAAWASFEYSETLKDPLLKWHRWIGLAILTLLFWRILWGFFGSSTARFSRLLHPPGTTVRYAAMTLRGAEPKYLGHNPLGTLMILALLGLVLAQTILGLFTVEHNDLTAGPLYLLVSEAARKTASSWHGWLFTGVTVFLIAAHVTANVFYALWRRDPVLKAMITGRKPADRYADSQAADVVRYPLVRAAILLFISAGLVYGSIVALGGRFLAMRMW